MTGGSSGIGRAAVVALCRAGARVVFVDVDTDGADATIAAARAEAGSAAAVHFIRADVSLPVEAARAVANAAQTLGGLDGAFNNAGVEGRLARLVDVTDEEWSRVLAVNLTGVFMCVRAQLRIMLERGRGSIVNNSSIAGLAGIAGGGPYTAAKHGVIGLTRAAALECAKAGVRVNAVCPGLIDTPMITRTTGGQAAALARLVASEPIGRMGAPSEVADAVVWLLSDASSFVTGHALAVDGGLLAQ